MNPNEQQQDSNDSSETKPEFGAPQQTDFSPKPDADFSPTPESNPEPATAETQPSFGQPAVASQPSNAQPAMQPTAFPAQPAATPQVSLENPGQTLGIVSIVLSFFGLSLIGIILGIVSRNKSKAVGASTTLGTVGMVIGIIGSVLAVLTFGFFIFLAIVGASISESDTKDVDVFSSSQSSSSESSTSTSDLADQAAVVASKAEAYKAKVGTYPEYKSDFDKYPESTIDSDIYLYTMFVSNQNVSYLSCSKDTAQVVYYKDASGTDLDITALGGASSTEPCVEIN